MKTLITGAGGQVGIDLIRRLEAGGDEVHGSDLPGRDRPAELSDSVGWHALDVTDPERCLQLLRALQPDRVFHLAAILSATGEQNPALTYAVNQGGTYNILEACRVAEVSQLIFASTIAVFGGDLPDPVPDAIELRPSTMYGVTKAAGEKLGEYYHLRYGLDFRAIRFPGLISATKPGGGTSDYALYMYFQGIHAGGYEAFCRPETRIPLMYMPDAIRAMIELSNAPAEKLSRRSYNIAAFSPTAQAIADTVERSLGSGDFSFAPDPKRQAILDSWPRALDDRCAREDWGWRAHYDLQTMSDHLIPIVRDLGPLDD